VGRECILSQRLTPDELSAIGYNKPNECQTSEHNCRWLRNRKDLQLRKRQERIAGVWPNCHAYELACIAGQVDRAVKSGGSFLAGRFSLRATPKNTTVAKPSNSKLVGSGTGIAKLYPKLATG